CFLEKAAIKHDGVLVRCQVGADIPDERNARWIGLADAFVVGRIGQRVDDAAQLVSRVMPVEIAILALHATATMELSIDCPGSISLAVQPGFIVTPHAHAPKPAGAIFAPAPPSVPAASSAPYACCVLAGREKCEARNEQRAEDEQHPVSALRLAGDDLQHSIG